MADTPTADPATPTPGPTPTPTPAPTPAPTPVVYATGSVKRNPDTLAVAVRTVYPDGIDAFADLVWAVMTVDNGGHYISQDKLADWVDVPTG